MNAPIPFSFSFSTMISHPNWPQRDTLTLPKSATPHTRHRRFADDIDRSSHITDDELRALERLPLVDGVRIPEHFVAGRRIRFAAPESPPLPTATNDSNVVNEQSASKVPGPENSDESEEEDQDDEEEEEGLILAITALRRVQQMQRRVAQYKKKEMRRCRNCCRRLFRWVRKVFRWYVPSLHLQNGDGRNEAGPVFATRLI